MRKYKLRNSLVATAIAGVLLTSLGVVSASAVERSEPDGQLDTDIVAVGVDQCVKPINDRVGNWMCLGDQADQLRTLQVIRASAQLQPAQLRTPGHCTIKGCWNVYSETLSDYSGSGFFGYGPTSLGKVELYYQVSLNGGQSISKPVQFKATTGVSSLTMEGDRLYYSSAHPEGNPVNGGHKAGYYTRGSLSAHDTAQWLPNGYKAYESTVQHGSVIHQWVWTMAEFPGNWYFYAKSVKFDLTRSSYRFGSPTYLGKEPVKSGHNAAG